MFLFQCSDIDTEHIAHRDGQYFVCGNTPHHSRSITHDAILEIVEARLTLILSVAIATLPILPIKVGNTLNVGKSGSIALRL